MNRRYREILNIILNTDGCITGCELARLCNVSVRTIRRDIKEINVLLKEYEIEVDSSIKKGYFFNKENKDIFKKHNIIRQVLDHEYIIEKPNLPRDRQMYILLKLTTKECISVEELAEYLYVSAATINNDIIIINKWLKSNLKIWISYSLNNGIVLKADEKEKRNIFSWVLSRKTNISTISKYWSYLFQGDNVIINARKLYHIVSAETKKYSYYLSGHSYQLLCYEILIAIKRFKLGFNLDYSNNRICDLIPVMNAIKENVEKEFKIDISETEWMNIQEYFKSKQLICGTNIVNVEAEEANHIVNEFIKAINYKFNIDLMSNPDNKYRLLLYIVPMINRLKYKHCIPEKISEKVIENYKTEFIMATEISHIIKNNLNLNMESIDLAYITINLAVMCGIWRHKLNTAIVCDYDESVISLIKNKIKSHFGEKIKITKLYDYQEFMYESKEKLRNIELIITTSTIADITNIPFIKINPEVEQNDIDIISEHISQSL